MDPIGATGGRISEKFSREQKYAMDLLRSGRSVLLMGVAGSGKSTLLREYLWELQETNPEMWDHTAVVAPTGVAAINVEGSTIHSFFQLPPYVLDPHEEEISKTGKWSKIRTLIIDEVSMVRSDLFACIDYRLRANKGRQSRLPFGGVRIVLIGDVCQLEPVMPNRNSDEHDFLMDRFGSGWFFNTNQFAQLNPVPVYLTRTFRQEDATLSGYLDRVRLGDQDVAEELNKVLKIDPNADGTTGPIVCPTIAQVNALNMEMLDRIPEDEKVFEGVRTGVFKEKDQRTDTKLTLKVGARVLSVSNYYNKDLSAYSLAAKGLPPIFINGSTGVVTSLDPLTVSFDRHGEVKVVPHIWESMKYDYVTDPETGHKKLGRHIVGTFTQIPLKLGWAITIHKSQGMGFENMVVDMGRGAFSSGQTYVALSRAMSLKGLVLRQKLEPWHIFTDEHAVDFHKAAVKIALELMETELGEDLRSAINKVNMEKVSEAYAKLGAVLKAIEVAPIPDQAAELTRVSECLADITEHLGIEE